MEPEAGPLLPLPMEDPDRHPGFFSRLGRTLALGFTDPMGFLDRVPAGDRDWAGLAFAMTVSVPFYLLLLIYPLLLAAMGLAAEAAGQPVPPLKWVSAGCGCSVLFAPALHALFILFSGFLHVLFLRLWGVWGGDAGLEHDLKAWCYVSGFMVLGFWTALGPIAALAVLILAGPGFARMHGVPAWRGVAAAVSHAVLVLLLVTAAFISIFMAAARDDAQRVRPPSPFVVPPPAYLPPAEALVSHVERARMVVNSLSGQGLEPEEAVDQALAILSPAQNPARNPFDPLHPAFVKGLPVRQGEVGLLPVREVPGTALTMKRQNAVRIVGLGRERLDRYVLVEK